MASAVFAVAVSVLIGLGSWQLQRLQWKEALIARIEAEEHINPRGRALADMVDDPANNLARGFLKGKYLRDQTVLVGPKMRDGKLGYWNITPLQLDNGRIVLINRGWGPADKDGGEVKTTRADVMAMGRLRESDRKDKPIGGNARQWHRLDIQGIGKALNLDVAPLALFAEVSEPLDMALPAPVATNLRNEHKNYAIFWFTMALALSVVYMLASLRGKRSASSPDPSDL